MLEALVYGRYSPRKSEDEYDIERQLYRCASYCTSRDFRVIEVITDPLTSGGIPLAEREGGRKLLDMVRRGRQVVTATVSRLFRDAADGIVTAKNWRDKGIALHLADQGGNSLDVSTPMGFRMFCFLVGDAEAFRMEISDYTSKAMIRHQKNGRRMSDQCPYGWKENPESPISNESGRHTGIIECPEEQATIELMRELHSDGVSYRGIAAELEQRGILNREGRRFHHGRVKCIVGRE